MSLSAFELFSAVTQRDNDQYTQGVGVDWDAATFQNILDGNTGTICTTDQQMGGDPFDETKIMELDAPLLPYINPSSEIKELHVQMRGTINISNKETDVYFSVDGVTYKHILVENLDTYQIGGDATYWGVTDQELADIVFGVRPLDMYWARGNQTGFPQPRWVKIQALYLPPATEVLCPPVTL